MGLNHHQKYISFVFDHANISLTCPVACYNYSNVLLSGYSGSNKTYFGNIMVGYIQVAIEFWTIFPFQMPLYKIH